MNLCDSLRNIIVKIIKHLTFFGLWKNHIISRFRRNAVGSRWYKYYLLVCFKLTEYLEIIEVGYAIYPANKSNIRFEWMKKGTSHFFSATLTWRKIFPTSSYFAQNSSCFYAKPFFFIVWVIPWNNVPIKIYSVIFCMFLRRFHINN